MMERYQLNQHEVEVIEHVVNTVLSIGRDEHFNKKIDMAFNNLDYYLANGQDKMVVIPDGLDWVVKFGLHEDGDTRCLKEVEIFEQAEKDGMAWGFAPCYLYRRTDDFVFTIMRACNCCEEAIDDEFFQSVSKSYDKEDFESEDEYYEAVNCETDELTDWDRANIIFNNNEICNWLSEHNINDLHCGNFGQLGDMNVLVDYSGYHW